MRLIPNVDFGFHQFEIFDAKKYPGCDWTDIHYNQGFARRPGVISIRTLIDFGTAVVDLDFDSPKVDGYERVVAVPLEIESGLLAIHGPEEDVRRETTVDIGHYRVTVAQRRVVDVPDLEEEVKIWFQKLDIPMQRSELLVVDDGLKPPLVLLEYVEEPRV